MIANSIVVEVPPDRAWRAWTAHVDLWWPPSHRRTGGTVTLEPHEDGRLYEDAPDGPIEYGRIRTWNPPEQLVYDFFIGSDAQHPSRVEVRFTPIAVGTRVDITHSQAQVPDARWTRSVQGYRTAWTHLVESFTATVPEVP